MTPGLARGELTFYLDHKDYLDFNAEKQYIALDLQ